MIASGEERAWDGHGGCDFQSARAGSLKDCVDDLVRRERVDGDGDMGGAVERESALIAGGQVGLVGEDGADVLGTAAAGNGGGQFHLKMNQEGAGAGEELRAGDWVLDSAAAEG